MHPELDEQTAFAKACQLHLAQKLAEARALYEAILSANPRHFNALHQLAILTYQEGKIEKAIEVAERAIQLTPNAAIAHASRATFLLDLARYEEALISLDRAVALGADHPKILSDRALALVQLKRYEKAVADCDVAIARAPDHASAHSLRSVALLEMGNLEGALASVDRALALRPDNAEDHRNRGAILEANQRPSDAAAAYGRALELKPDMPRVESRILHHAMRVCDWTGISEKIAAHLEKVETGRTIADPFLTVNLPSTLHQQQVCAASYFKHVTQHVTPQAAPPRIPGTKIRVGYFSADFNDHVVARVIAGMLESHDRTHFEIVGFQLERRPSDSMQQRLVRALDTFIDVSSLSDREVVAAARARKIDIAIDLMGYTKGARSGIFALRAAPIQASYIGYPGTMGSTCFDYIIGDAVVIPDHHRASYTEKICYLPNTYQANDRTLAISDKPFTKRAEGLPETGIVFCCFNNTHKITPDVFDSWMRILTRVDGSVLWLYGSNATATNNLRREAEARGVSASRLVFAERLPLDGYLARHRLADIVVDTFHYGGHGTASNALWAGVPLVSRIGNTFASRVPASLLTAVGLPDLIAEDTEQYEKIAISLASQPRELAEVKDRLVQNRLSYPLFDTVRFTRNLEAGYRAMIANLERGLSEDIVVRETMNF